MWPLSRQRKLYSCKRKHLRVSRRPGQAVQLWWVDGPGPTGASGVTVPSVLRTFSPRTGRRPGTSHWELIRKTGLNDCRFKLLCCLVQRTKGELAEPA